MKKYTNFCVVLFLTARYWLSYCFSLLESHCYERNVCSRALRVTFAVSSLPSICIVGSWHYELEALQCMLSVMNLVGYSVLSFHADTLMRPIYVTFVWHSYAPCSPNHNHTIIIFATPFCQGRPNYYEKMPLVQETGMNEREHQHNVNISGHQANSQKYVDFIPSHKPPFCYMLSWSCC
jgi:hypothetical protein